MSSLCVTSKLTVRGSNIFSFAEMDCEGLIEVALLDFLFVVPLQRKMRDVEKSMYRKIVDCGISEAKKT